MSLWSKILLLLVSVSGLMLSAAPGRRPDDHRRAPEMWRVFSMLPSQEQREMMKLQRSDPEKFQQIMQEKVEKFQTDIRARHQKINELVKQIRETSDPEKKTALKQELRLMFKDSFEKQLAITRRNIEESKKRTAKMEQELQKREQNADAIIDAITNNAIEGKHRRRPRHGK